MVERLSVSDGSMETGYEYFAALLVVACVGVYGVGVRGVMGRR